MRDVLEELKEKQRNNLRNRDHIPRRRGAQLRVEWEQPEQAEGGVKGC